MIEIEQVGHQGGKSLALARRLGRLDPDLVLVLRPGPLADLLVAELPDRDVRVTSHRDLAAGVVLAYPSDAVPAWAGPPRART